MNKQDNFEPIVLKSEQKQILGFSQNQELFINPEKIKPLDEKGNFIEQKLPDEDIIISSYWQHKRKTVALLMLLSSGILFLMIVNESNFLNMFFDLLKQLFDVIVARGIGSVWKG